MTLQLILQSLKDIASHDRKSLSKHDAVGIVNNVKAMVPFFESALRTMPAFNQPSPIGKRGHLDNTAHLLLILGGENVSGLIKWLDENRKPHERVNVHSWVRDWWYVIVEDKRMDKYPESSLIGFTVCLSDDTIMWSNDYRHNSSGGNCFCRSVRWARKLRKKYPNVKFTRSTHDTDKPGDQVYDYRPVPQKKVKATA